MVLGMLALLALQPAALAEGTAEGGCSIRAPLQLRKASPLSFGMNDVMGTIINLSYTDPALVKSVQALGVGALRHPEGAGRTTGPWRQRVGLFARGSINRSSSTIVDRPRGLDH